MLLRTNQNMCNVLLPRWCAAKDQSKYVQCAVAMCNVLLPRWCAAKDQSKSVHTQLLIRAQDLLSSLPSLPRIRACSLETGPLGNAMHAQHVLAASHTRRGFIPRKGVLIGQTDTLQSLRCSSLQDQFLIQSQVMPLSAVDCPLTVDYNSIIQSCSSTSSRY